MLINQYNENGVDHYSELQYERYVNSYKRTPQITYRDNTAEGKVETLIMFHKHDYNLSFVPSVFQAL